MSYLDFEQIWEMVDHTNIPEESSCAIVVLNPSLDRFIKIFTKFEVVTAFEYLAGAVSKFSIPVFVASTRDETMRLINKDESNVETQKFKSRYDDEFITRYTKILSTLPSHKYEYTDFDVFSLSDLKTSISETHRKNILICGNWLETDIIGSVFGSFKLSVTPIVVSDACSSESERIFVYLVINSSSYLDLNF